MCEYLETSYSFYSIIRRGARDAVAECGRFENECPSYLSHRKSGLTFEDFYDGGIGGKEDAVRRNARVHQAPRV